MPRMTELIQGDVGVPPSHDQAWPPHDQAGPPNTEAVSYRSLWAAKQPRTVESETVPIGTDRHRLAETELARIGAEVRDGSPPDIQRAKGVASGLVESLLEGDHLLVRALSARGSVPIITNMVNVAILATRIAIGLGWPRKELEEMALAGLLHDVGMFRLPESLVIKSQKLTPQEVALVRQHPELGHEVVRALGAEYEWLAAVVLQEHERWNGGGYPKGLKEDQIIEYACIIGIVDIYDALLSRRPYRRRFLPHEAMREILIAEKASFPSAIIKGVIHEFGPFPVGTVVRLNTGEVCAVKARTAGYPLRPLVEVRPRAEPHSSRETRLLDLSRLPLLGIVEVLESEGPSSS